MKNIRFIRNNQALAGVIEALLLVALVAIILSIIQTSYVPVIMKQKEAEHMKTVENQFAHLKSVIETQAIMGVAGGGSPIAYSPMASPVTLGSSELPYFISQGSFGAVTIINNDSSNHQEIKMYYAPGNYTEIPLTSIKFESTNYYFDNQNYILEGGALILEQPGEGTTIKVDIPMKVEKSGDSIKIFYTIPVFNTPDNRNNIGGKDNCFVRTSYSDSSVFEIQLDNQNDYFHICTDYTNAWLDSLTRNDSGVLWEYNNSGMIKVNPSSDNPKCVEIKSGNASITIEITRVEMDIQVGAGYVVPKK